PQNSLPYEIDSAAPRAEIVLGTNHYHTPPTVIATIEQVVASHGYSFAIDRPFAGTYIPLPLHKDPRVTAFMLEIRRDTYMDEIHLQKTSQFDKIQSCIQEIIKATMKIEA
ncbi:MAG: N-formylglutamate amidohydrolase, partial [Bdellovibrionales bacterium]|nr:N-formylglutamate amidohydrolase [Bdellovibrionales bacterium]